MKERKRVRERERERERERVKRDTNGGSRLRLNRRRSETTLEVKPWSDLYRVYIKSNSMYMYCLSIMRSII